MRKAPKTNMNKAEKKAEIFEMQGLVEQLKINNMAIMGLGDPNYKPHDYDPIDDIVKPPTPKEKEVKF